MTTASGVSRILSNAGFTRRGGTRGLSKGFEVWHPADYHETPSGRLIKDLADEVLLAWTGPNAAAVIAKMTEVLEAKGYTVAPVPDFPSLAKVTR